MNYDALSRAAGGVVVWTNWGARSEPMNNERPHPEGCITYTGIGVHSLPPEHARPDDAFVYLQWTHSLTPLREDPSLDLCLI